MLDALMGPSRDLAPSAKKDEWRDRTVCKSYLAGFCPYDKAVLGGRRSIPACDKIHNDILREAFNNHADGAPDSRFRRDCEDQMARDIADVLALRESYANEQRNNKNAELKIRKSGNNKDVGRKKRKAMEIKEQADAIDDTEDVQMALKKQQLLEEFALRLEEYEAFAKEQEKLEDAAAPKCSSCKVCGAAYNGDHEYQLIIKYKAHSAYLQVEEWKKKLEEKKEARAKQRAEEASKVEEKDEDASKKGDGKIEGKGDSAKKRSRSKSKDAKKRSRSRSRDRRRSRSRDRSRDRRRNGKKQSKSRSRGRHKSSGDKKDRQRSRERRR